MVWIFARRPMDRDFDVVIEGSTRIECPVRCRPRSTTSSGIHPVTSIDLKPSPLAPSISLPSDLGTLQIWSVLNAFLKWPEAKPFFLAKALVNGLFDWKPSNKESIFLQVPQGSQEKSSLKSPSRGAQS
ncbi:unnamed protein product [Caenorhabditis auriculariae]|uniref:Uncharacterized protein n=1 Tax=Caenorhabditis auriculariae TaxID=2777116 RepID=A0A8S1H536_9PELO|nr:unnamed protein product [Caenorhabditis auriculariae]